MASLQSKPSGPSPIFDEKEWVIHVSRTLNEELEEETEIPASIFHVPKLLLDLHPHSYVPQQVAIGPYHSGRSEIRDMERYKLAAAKRNQQDFKKLKLQIVVKELMEYEGKIRANYQTVLNLSGETLAWMMAVDASFLLEFLQVCAVKRNKVGTNVVSGRLTRLANLGQNKTAHNAILKDTALVENQIPLFVMRKLLEMYFSSLEKADELLFSMMVRL